MSNQSENIQYVSPVKFVTEIVGLGKAAFKRENNGKEVPNWDKQGKKKKSPASELSPQVQ